MKKLVFQKFRSEKACTTKTPILSTKQNLQIFFSKPCRISGSCTKHNTQTRVTSPTTPLRTFAHHCMPRMRASRSLCPLCCCCRRGICCYCCCWRWLICDFLVVCRCDGAFSTSTAATSYAATTVCIAAF